MKIQTSIFAFFIVCFYTIVGYTQDSTSYDDTQISILTCRSGDELFSTFGHSAIRIYNPKEGIDEVFNYGMFSFNTPNFYPKFMRGKLPYWLGSYSYNRFLREYHREKRSIIEQVLNLDANQKETILNFLNDNIQPENREYEYDFFLDNCATRIVDVYHTLDSVTYKNTIDEKTFRDLLKENLQNMPWSDFGIDLVIGARADKITTRRHQMFLPEYLMDNIDHTYILRDREEVKLARPPNMILDFERENKQRKSRSANYPLYVMVFILLLTVILNVFYPKLACKYNNVLLIIAGIFGIFLLFMWFGTEHKPTRDNWNVLWLNPLLLILFFIKNTTFKSYFTYALLAFLGISVLNCLYQFLPQFFNLGFLPLILSIGVALYYKLNTSISKESVV